MYFGTDIGQKAFVQQWKLFLKEKLNTTLKNDSKSKTEISYISKEINSPTFFGVTPTTLHVTYVHIHKDSLVWILFPKEDGSLEKWRSLANQFLVDKLPLLYNNEFEILKKDVHFLEKELDSYRNKLISNRKFKGCNIADKPPVAITGNGWFSSCLMASTVYLISPM